MICDSPFSSLKVLARELVESAQLNVPRFAVGIGLRLVRSSVRSRANFDLNILEPIHNVDKCFVPALFAAAENDNFIKPRHAELIHTAYAGDKNIVKFPGDHNSTRPAFFIDSCVIFLHNAMYHDELANFHPTSGRALSIGAQEFTMPAPLATSPRAQIQNHAFRENVVDGEEDEDDAFQEMLKHALLLSMAENVSTNTNASEHT